MSIKKLFDNKSKTYLKESNEKDLFKDVESARNVKAISERQNKFVPQIDYTKPERFARYGSAYLYYKSAIEWIHDYYPYDGSGAEINEYKNKLLDIERYIFDNLYPRTNGYIIISADGWGGSTNDPDDCDGYGISNTLEYITFKGGPGTGSATSSDMSSLLPSPHSSKNQSSNVYDEDLYTNMSLPSDYGSGSRESNLKSDFDNGVTVEFWLKTGSATPLATLNNETEKQVVFDLWNNNAETDPDYGRITIELLGTASAGTSPFMVTVQSGNASPGIFQQTIGANINVDTLAKWHHYAFVMQNTGSGHAVKFFVDGEYNDTLTHTGTIGTLPAKDMMGRIGSLLAAPSETTATGSLSGAGKLYGSMDEFRFWKVARTPREIGLNWFDQVKGGVNTDISNTTLGVYYKFNEGITGVPSTDNVVLDYSGRVSNGVWTGYGSNSRATGSAIVLATGSAYTYENKDPIIYSNHPEVVALKTALLDSGSYHDRQNNGSILNSLPTWIIEEDEERGSEFTTNLRYVSHVLGTYFDKVYLQISQFPKFKHSTYTSASYRPIPFARHLPQSLGLETPELFIDSTIIEKFLNRSATGSFENDLTETKNLIYLNLYNNLTNIFKSKGTEKSIRNVFRCFNVDDKLINLNMYADNTTYNLKNNLKQTLINKKSINFNHPDNTSAVVYQKSYTGSAFGNVPSYVTPGDTQGHISGSWGASYRAIAKGGPGAGHYRGLEDIYGFTMETDITFPSFYRSQDLFNRSFHTSSLFGLYTVPSGASGFPLNRIKEGAATTWITSLGNNADGDSEKGPDVANFQVFAVRDEQYSKNVRFMLSSSNEGLDGNVPFPVLTSSTFFGVYNNNRWNLSVRLVPSLTSSYGVAGIVSGSTESFKMGLSTYDLIFDGYNNENGFTQNSFKLTASITHDVATNFLNASKRVYAGARRTNITGTVLNLSDVQLNSVRYWTKFIEDGTLQQHANDFDNAGTSGSYQNTSPRDLNSFKHDIQNLHSLALNWDFENVTGSDANGNFFIVDLSSGSLDIRNNFGWAGNWAGYQHTGYGYGFATSSAKPIEVNPANYYKFIDPEKVISSDMVNILSSDDIVFDREQTVPDYYFTLEKSMYNAVSEDMLKFFAGVVDFNNIIGEPVNRYRARYKNLEKLREIFFRRVTATSNIEKFIDYYKWFDDSLSTILAQLIPLSADFEADMMNVIESHVLERNKYQTKFPTIDFKEPDPDAAMKGARENQYSWKDGSSTIPASPRSTKENRIYWDQRAERSSTELSASRSTNAPAVNSNIDVQREIYKRVIYSSPVMSSSTPVSFTSNGTAYVAAGFQSGSFAKLYNIQFDNYLASGSTIKGGVNFTDNKNIDFTYNALRPAGPVENDGQTFIPQNVILGFANHLVGLHETHQWTADKHPRLLTKRYLKTLHGRNFDYDGFGYTNVKSSFAFPFNIVSSSVVSGYNKIIVDKVTGGVEIVNLHHDTYGDSFEVPMQGPFTDHVVGGHQSRHVPINTGSDMWYNRPEAWKMLFGTCDGYNEDHNLTGAIGMVAPDYPWPEANEDNYAGGVLPYPMTASHKAWLYRDFVAKRPVNFKNIMMKTGSRTRPDITIIGNYERNYQVVNVAGAYENPRAFIEEQPTLPDSIYLNHSGSTTNVRTFLDARRDADSHFEFIEEYNSGYLTGTENKSVIVSRFSAPGGIEVMSKGYLDFKSSEFSVYNSLLNKNFSVIRPSQTSTGSYSESIGSGTAGIRVSDIHGKDFGLRAHLTRHSARFGRDSMFVTSSDDLPGALYDQLPSLHKVNRNRLIRIKMSNDGDIYSPKTMTTATASKMDNFYVKHAIPRMDRQYSWVTGAILPTDTDPRYYGHAAEDGFYSSSADGYVAFFNYVSASSVVPESLQTIYQSTNRLNILTYDPITASDANTLGFPLTIPNDEYVNGTLTDKLGVSSFVTSSTDYFNLLITKRGGVFGWNWKRLRIQEHPILRDEIKSGTLSRAAIEDNSIETYNLPPVSLRGRPVTINFDTSDGNTTIRATHNNERNYFNSVDLNNLFNLPSFDTPTPYEQVLTAVKNSAKYSLNWIMYCENVFPSTRNEFLSSSRKRLDYDNKFWRNSQTDRVAVGNTQENSFGVSVVAVSQSSWPLDAQIDFLTRSGAPNVGVGGDVQANIRSGSAGELQNNYFSYHTGVAYTAANVESRMSPGGLYARKHFVGSPRSVVAPTGPNISETGSIEKGLEPFNVGIQIDVFGGEALWEAADQAGIVTINNGSPSFQASASSPWFNDYDDFSEDLMLVARDFAIVPEYRISSHVEDYIKYGLSSKNKTNTFEIPGTLKNSSTGSFYVDYSNSEFLTEFLNIKEDSLLTAKEIRLVCSAAIRFNPYKGLYPAQRTLDLVSQFSRSYGAGFDASIEAASTFKYSGYDLIQNHGGLLRPLMQPLYSPGILYNSIKSGIAVDYPILTDSTKLSASYYGATDGDATDNWAITPHEPPSSTKYGYRGGEFWDMRIPFEAILAPEKYIAGVQIIDVEPHPSASLNATASMGAASDEIYSMMASNFFGEVGAFFLEDGTFTTLKSDVVTDDLRFKSGSVYGARIKLRRSVSGSRDYRGDSGSAGTNAAYGLAGGLLHDGTGFGKTTFPLPQDPKQGLLFKESFTMYSRPSAFGPAVAGQPDGTGSIAAAVVKSFPMDSFNGYNWSFTPPYTNGEAWCDLIFRPDPNKSYDLEQILSEVSSAFWRADPGHVISNKPCLISSFEDSDYTQASNYIYSGHNVNSNAMQLSASINLFGVERVLQQETDSYGNKLKSTNITAGKKWVIQPKWETPMLNFNDKGVHPITNADGNLTLPSFASGSVPRGMWHQFGVQPDEASKGIFLEIGDIPTDWLKGHYDVLVNDTIYNNLDADTGDKVYKNMQSLTSLVGFSSTSTTKRLGQLADQKIIREAVVAVPYIIDSVEEKSSTITAFNSTRKSFISIPPQRYLAAMSSAKGTESGDSLDAAGESIRKLVQKMERYILPPQFDFLRNSAIDPIVMYIFEFEYKLDKDDLSYIWQNLAPRNYKKMSLEYQSVAHELLDTELLSESNIVDNDNLRWMVFKVKQKANTDYYNLITPQVGEASKDIFSFDDETSGYKIGFNWPYDYISFVESIKIDTEVLFAQPDTSTVDPTSINFDSTTPTLRTPTRGSGQVRDITQTTEQAPTETVTTTTPTRRRRTRSRNGGNSNGGTGGRGGPSGMGGY